MVGRESSGAKLVLAGGSPRPVFTVFTATFDRASTLPRVRASLEAQSFKDFEWLIVDDGSTDGTRDLVEGWAASSSLMIRYLHQENAGKHVAFNRAVCVAQGDFFLPLDSDDECVPQALERFLHHWESIPVDVRPTFSAVSALSVDEQGRIVGEAFPTDPYDSDPLSLYFDSRGRGDKWGFHRTEILRRFPFPEPPEVTFVSEAVVWFAIGRHYRTRYVNDPLLIIHSDAPGERLHQLTRRTVAGRLLMHQDVITSYLDKMTTSPRLVLKSGINYCRYSFHLGIGPIRQIRGLRRWISRVLAAVCLVPGAVLFARDVIRARRGPWS